MTGTIIDISHHQGTINWLTIGAAHQARLIDAVIMKATDGTTGVDSQFTNNQAGARQNQVPCGFYHFAQPGGPVTGNATNFVRTVGPLAPGEVIALDVESSAAHVIVAADVPWVVAWIEQARQATGATPVVYMDSATLARIDWSPVAATGAPLWLANYGPNTGHPGIPPKARWWPAWALWQFTSTASLAGLHPVDASIIANGTTFRSLGHKGDNMPGTSGVWALTDLGPVLASIDGLYLAAGHPLPPPDRYGWTPTVAQLLADGQDPKDTLDFIRWALQNPTAAGQL